ncbi:divergent polysaccharide deacetylase family protein [Campylobacter hepaticus]|nr:divergent polysaccharide deacetylase family protein [Campylobacter hepaticus]
MSKKKLSFIVLIFFLICIVLFVGILIKYKNSQNINYQSDFIIQTKENQEINIDFIDKNITNEHFGIFKPIEEESIQNDQAISILEQRIKDLNISLKEQNLSNKEQNFSLESNQNFILKDENTSLQDNLHLQKDVKPIKDNSLPKLAIIIDDMANANQVKNLKALKLKLNPSFFPPDKNHNNTPKLALQFDFYMVHLPLAAIDYNKPELDTLSPNDSKERIYKKIKQIKKDFKNLRYINNHTGSLFTSNEKAMRNLYEVLKTQNIFFVDSKTIAYSKASKIAKELGQIYIQRDIFLDNEDDIAYIKKQLFSAVKLAQKKGFALAIAHPKENTFKALEQSKDLLKSVNLVYLSEIYGK